MLDTGREPASPPAAVAVTARADDFGDDASARPGNRCRWPLRGGEFFSGVIARRFLPRDAAAIDAITAR